MSLKTLKIESLTVEFAIERNRSKLLKAGEPQFHVKNATKSVQFEAIEPRESKATEPKDENTSHAALTVNLSFDDAEFRVVSGGPMSQKLAQREAVKK